MDSRERYSGVSILDRRVSRRRFNSAAVEAVWVIGLSGAALGAISYVVATKEGESQKHYNKPVETEAKRLIADRQGDHEPILRSELSLSDEDIVGYLGVGTPVEAIEILGPVYPTGQADLKTRVEGEDYGIWYRVVSPVRVTTSEGSVKESIGFIAGNFLKKPEEPSGK